MSDVRLVGMLARVGVLAAVTLMLWRGTVLAKTASPSFGWISSGVTMEGGVDALAKGMDGSIWVASREGLGRFDRLGHLHRDGRVEPGLAASGLVQGPDGALWDARPSAIVPGDSEVLRIDAAGARRELMLEGVAEGVAAGPAGGVWVAADEGYGRLPHCRGTTPESIPCVPSIVKLTPESSAEFFPIPPSMYRLRLIVAGADGDLWFGAQDGPSNGIVRMTTAGSLHYWKLGSGGGEEEVRGLAPGSRRDVVHLRL